MSQLMAGFNCSWCHKEDMCVTLDNPNKESMMVCIPCLAEVRQDWLEEEAENKNKLIRIK